MSAHDLPCLLVPLPLHIGELRLLSGASQNSFASWNQYWSPRILCDYLSRTSQGPAKIRHLCTTSLIDGAFSGLWFFDHWNQFSSQFYNQYWWTNQFASLQVHSPHVLGVLLCNKWLEYSYSIYCSLGGLPFSIAKSCSFIHQRHRWQESYFCAIFPSDSRGVICKKEWVSFWFVSVTALILLTVVAVSPQHLSPLQISNSIRCRDISCSLHNSRWEVRTLFTSQGATKVRFAVKHCKVHSHCCVIPRLRLTSFLNCPLQISNCSKLI